MAQMGSNEHNDNDNSSRSIKMMRYGILGCAGIAAKIARAIDLEPGSKVTMVASRDLQKAQNFCLRNCHLSWWRSMISIKKHTIVCYEYFLDLEGIDILQKILRLRSMNIYSSY